MTKRTGSSREGFVATKLIPPRWDPAAIVPRTPADMEKVGSAILVSITGSAGSGKSTLMGQFHAACTEAGEAACWINLDADDNDPGVFADYLIPALAQIDPSVMDRAFAIQKDYPGAAFADLYTSLLSYIVSWRRPAAIFLDDFQHVTHPQITAFLDRLIVHLPATVQLFVASRRHLPLQLERARVSGRVMEFDQHALNFNASEATELLRRIHGVELAADDLNTLWRATEGWVAGLQLAAITLRRRHGTVREFIQSFSGRDKDLTNYLAETVLDTQPEEIRQFLLHTAPLHRMCADLCGAATLSPQPAEMLGELEQRKLFTISLDRQGEWFRYHHLFGTFLRNRLQTVDPAMFVTVCERAETWCLNHGMVTQAIQYALDAGRFEHAADLIADRCLAVAQSEGDLYTILDWMRRLPRSCHMRQPQICLSHAWACAFFCEPQQAIELSDQVLKGLSRSRSQGWSLPASRRRAYHNFALAIQAVAEANLDAIDSCLANSRDLLEKAGDDEAFIRATVGNCLSYCHFAVRNPEAAINAAAEARRQARRAASSYASVWAEFLYTAAASECGRLEVAQEHANRAAVNTGSARTMKNYSGCLVALLNAEIACQHGDFHGAAGHMELGRSFTAAFGPLEALLIAYRTDARVRAWTGDLAVALDTLNAGRDIALRRGYTRLVVHLSIEEIDLRLAFGQTREALAKVDELGLRALLSTSTDPARFASTKYPLKVLSARLALAAGDARRANVTLARLIYAHKFQTGSLLHLTLSALRAVALWRCGDQTQALEKLKQVIVTAAPENCVYALGGCGRELLPILDTMNSRSNSSEPAGESDPDAFVTRLVAMLENQDSVHPGTDARLPEPALSPDVALTAREIELLKLVSAGLPNKKLAEAAHVSEATVKWHLHNINEKLGVTNRTAAVAKARTDALI